MKKNTVLWLSLLVMLLWGSLFPTVKLGFAAFSVETTGDILLFAGVRFLVCGALITLLALLRDGSSFRAVPSSLFPILLSGLFAIVLHYACTYTGLNLTESGKTAILKQSGALLYVLLSPLFFKNEHLTAGKLAGVLLGFCGVIAMNYTGSGGVRLGTGEILILCASLCTVAANVISKRLFSKVAPITATGVSQLFGGAVLSAVGLLMGGELHAVGKSALPLLLYIFAASTVSYCLWYSILKHASLSGLFIVKFAEPLFSCLLGALLLGENILDPRNLIAFLLIGGGIALAQGLPKGKKEGKIGKES